MGFYSRLNCRAAQCTGKLTFYHHPVSAAISVCHISSCICIRLWFKFIYLSACQFLILSLSLCDPLVSLSPYFCSIFRMQSMISRFYFVRSAHMSSLLKVSTSYWHCVCLFAVSIRMLTAHYSPALF